MGAVIKTGAALIATALSTTDPLPMTEPTAIRDEYVTGVIAQDLGDGLVRLISYSDQPLFEAGDGAAERRILHKCLWKQADLIRTMQELAAQFGLGLRRSDHN